MARIETERAEANSGHAVLAGGTIYAIVSSVLSMAIFSVGEGISKVLVRDYPTIQVVWGKYAFLIICMILVIRWRRWPELVSTAQPVLQCVRATLPLLAGIFIVGGLKYIPLAEATAIMFISPILLIILSTLFLSERVGRRRLIAILAGFLGILIILRPGSDAVQWPALMPLAAACLMAVYNFSTKILTRTDKSLTILFYYGIVGLVLTTLALPFGWRTPTLEAWILMAGSGVAYGFAYYFWISALAAAPVSTVVPFTYTQIVFATAFGIFVFGDVPDLQAILGASIIIFSGLYVYRCYGAPAGQGDAEAASPSRRATSVHH